MSSHTILCGNCGTPVEGPEDATPEDVITCSRCGQSDTLAQIIDSAQEFVTDEASRSLDDRLAQAVKGSKVIKFTPSSRPNREYRWKVADFKL